MRNRHARGHDPLTAKMLSIVLLGLALTACGGPGDDSGEVITSIPLPTDTLLDLPCEDAGINNEGCVLEDKNNPYRFVAVREFDVNNPDAQTKFDLAAGIPAGRTGAKARFYLWATALAKFQSGENQYYTAQALHELWNYNDDPIIQDQALRAYRSVLDNFFGSVTFFPSSDFGLLPNVDYSILLNELTAAQVSCSPDYKSLLPPDQTTDPFFGRGLLAEWGYTYEYQGACQNGVVFVNEFP